MKKLIAVIGLALVAGITSAKAQTNTPESFLATATTWGSSFNTNADHSWTNATLQYDTGIATITGSGIADRLYVQYDINKFGLGLMGQFEGVGSPFGAIEGTAQYNLIEKYDFKLGVEVDAGYDFNALNGKGVKTGAIEVDPGLFTAKMMTANTYAEVKYLVPIESQRKFNPNGMLYVGLGATF